jgi:tetratricopeptide (TPR) repeat protein
LSVELGTSNACNDCHKKPNETPQWAADAIKKWYGERPKREPHWGPAIKAGRAGTPEGEKLLLDLIARNSTPSVVRATAIELLAGYPSSPSVTARQEALRDGDSLVRLTAVRALPGDNEQMLVMNLASMINDPVLAVRLAAAAQLAHLKLDKLTDSQRKAFEKAMVELRESQDLSLDHAGGHLVLASFARQHERFEEAIQHLVDAIKLEPYMAGPRQELASLMQELKGDEAEIRRLRAEEAELLERDAKLAPNNADIFLRLGKVRYLLDEYDQAEAAFKTACEKAPRDYECLLMLALMQQQQYEKTSDNKHFDDAIATVKAMHQLNRDDPRAKEILRGLLVTWHQKNPNAKPDWPKK